MLTSTLFTNSDFSTMFEDTMIKGQNVHNFSVFFLVNNQLVTKTTKSTKAQMGATGGKGGVTRWKLNGKAISKAALNDALRPTENQEVLYSSNVYELKAHKATN